MANKANVLVLGLGALAGISAISPLIGENSSAANKEETKSISHKSSGSWLNNPDLEARTIDEVNNSFCTQLSNHKRNAAIVYDLVQEYGLCYGAGHVVDKLSENKDGSFVYMKNKELFIAEEAFDRIAGKYNENELNDDYQKQKMKKVLPSKFKKMDNLGDLANNIFQIVKAPLLPITAPFFLITTSADKMNIENYISSFKSGALDLIGECLEKITLNYNKSIKNFEEKRNQFLFEARKDYYKLILNHIQHEAFINKNFNEKLYKALNGDWDGCVNAINSARNMDELGKATRGLLVDDGNALKRIEEKAHNDTKYKRIARHFNDHCSELESQMKSYSESYCSHATKLLWQAMKMKKITEDSKHHYEEIIRISEIIALTYYNNKPVNELNELTKSIAMNIIDYVKQNDGLSLKLDIAVKNMPFDGINNKYVNNDGSKPKNDLFKVLKKDNQLTLELYVPDRMDIASMP